MTGRKWVPPKKDPLYHLAKKTRKCPQSGSWKGGCAGEVGGEKKKKDHSEWGKKSQ